MGHVWAGTFDTASSAMRLLSEKNPKLRKKSQRYGNNMGVPTLVFPSIFLQFLISVNLGLGQSCILMKI